MGNTAARARERPPGTYEMMPVDENEEDEEGVLPRRGRRRGELSSGIGDFSLVGNLLCTFGAMIVFVIFMTLRHPHGTASSPVAMSGGTTPGEGTHEQGGIPGRRSGASATGESRGTRVLFVGNSFVYGPPAHGARVLNNLPRLFKFIAEGLGLGPIDIAEDTIGGCVIHAMASVP